MDRFSLAGLQMRILLAFLLVALPAGAQGSDAAPAPAVDALPGFVYVPPGPVNPGATLENVKERAGGDTQRQWAVQYDTWGALPPGSIALPGYHFLRYELTNAQWKEYLDANYRVEHTTDGQETLEDLAAKYVKFRGESVPTEWTAIYAFNADAIHTAIRKADEAAAEKARAANEVAPPPLWQEDWTVQNPDPANDQALSRVHLPAGIKLTLYAYRTPSHWYGWCRLAGLRVGREYCDIRKPAKEAFQVPDTPEVKEADLRAADFASYPVRDVSPNEQLEFAEWAGCHLPSEYEWERAARADRPNTEQYPFAGKWDRSKQANVFAWVDNVACRKGPVAVDDPRMHQGDGPFGTRHMIGNVWELTRSFFDFHPMLRPQPPEPETGIFNYALIAKGGAWGDGWIFQQISARTGLLGHTCVLALTGLNRADSLGVRLVRHPVPGHDLLLHSLLRLTYDKGRGAWGNPLPHAFSLPRMIGVDTVHIVPDEAPYAHIRGKAEGIAFTPIWLTSLTEAQRREDEGLWRQSKADGRSYAILGILRSDLPLQAGVRLEPADAKQLADDRAEYERLKELARKQGRRLKKGEQPIVVPPEPPQPDAYEQATEKLREKVGMWREGVVPPGEWYVVYWYGYVALANKALLMPPEAFFLIDARKDLRRVREPAGEATLDLDAAKDIATLQFSVEEEPEPRKPQSPPGQSQSDMWALCEVHPDGWPARKKGTWSYHIKVDLTFEPGALKAKGWGATEPKKAE